MKQLRRSLLAFAMMAGLTPAVAQQFPSVPDHSVIGRIGTGSSRGPSQAIPFTSLPSAFFGAQTANTVYAGPSSGSTAIPAFRALVGADLPAPGASSLGGAQSKTCSTSNWFNSLSTGGIFACTQPAFSDISGTIAAAQLPNPSASTLGGVQSKAVVSHQFLNGISTSGVPGAAQPACTDLSDATSCNAARGQLPGEITTGSATAGNVGEYIESSILLGSATALVSSTGKTVATITLTAGDWDVDCVLNYAPVASTSITAMFASISLVTNTLDLTVGRFTGGPMAAVVPGTVNYGYPVPPLRFSVSGSTNLFMVAQSTFTVSTLSAYGIIRARRVR